ncbi:MAG TPA: MgtC/SapB family protein [Balneolales bacterium]|nr:MgtC/SapB family protein [Balneolales bacterium]
MLDLFIRLGLALAIGFLIGIERGWQERTASEGQRMAGIRTFGLIGLLGGIWTILANQMGIILLGFSFLAFAAILIISHIQSVKEIHDVGITTVVAGLITFALGALAVLGQVAIAASAGVVTTILLSLKPVLHRWLQKLESQELSAILKLLLISVVILPVLPNRGFGPWNVLNPYEIWLMVVLVAALSFVGYFAIKIAGQEQGTLFTSLFGGLVSSTVITLNFARLVREHKHENILTAGVLVSAATMFPRILVIAGIINIHLVLPLAIPFVIMAIVTYLEALWFWKRRKIHNSKESIVLKNPFQLSTAVKFGLLLSAIIFLASVFRAWLGDAGLYLLSAISGIADVDAITLSISRMTNTDLLISVATFAIFIAAIVNTAVKGFIFMFITGFKKSYRLLLAFLITIIAGSLSLLFLPI